MPSPSPLARPSVLLLNVLVIATCGLVYELLAGTLASYLMGDSVTQFSLVIGVYLSALGVGAWLSRYVGRGIARRFVEIELAVALIGGLSAPILFIAYAELRSFYLALYAVVIVVGILVGLEIPLLMRLMEGQLAFKEIVARVLTFDYIGALVASLLFPLVLVPKAGLVRTSLAMGLLNAAVGLWATVGLRGLIPGSVTGLRLRAGFVIALLAVGLWQADRLTTWMEDDVYADEVVYARTTPYQRIVVTRGRAGFQLFLNGHLQFASADEYRYHEALVHPALAATPAARRVLVLGGGDGLALREILKYPTVQSVTLVDLDPAMTGLSAAFGPLATLNGGAFSDRRVHVVNQDAMVWLQAHTDRFDVAIVDFPDPHGFAVGKLYTTRFYRLLRARLAPGATVAVQSTSPLFARASFWCIVRTLEAAGFSVQPYGTAVPSFGVWGFSLARTQPFAPPTHLRPDVPRRFLNDAALPGLFALSADLGPVPVEVNRLDNQALVRYYESDWRRWE